MVILGTACILEVLSIEFNPATRVVTFRGNASGIGTPDKLFISITDANNKILTKIGGEEINIPSNGRINTSFKIGGTTRPVNATISIANCRVVPRRSLPIPFPNCILEVLSIEFNPATRVVTFRGNASGIGIPDQLFISITDANNKILTKIGGEEINIPSNGRINTSFRIGGTTRPVNATISIAKCRVVPRRSLPIPFPSIDCKLEVLSIEFSPATRVVTFRGIASGIGTPDQLFISITDANNKILTKIGGEEINIPSNGRINTSFKIGGTTRPVNATISIANCRVVPRRSLPIPFQGR